MLESRGVRVVVEPWLFGQPEPEPGVDLTDCDIVLTLGMRDPLRILQQAPNVKWIHSMSVGVDAILNAEVRSNDIVITNAKGCTAIPISEHALALMLALARGVPAMVRQQRAKVWGEIAVRELSEATVGIVGYGHIGHEIAQRCKSFGMRVIGCRKHPDKGSARHEAADAVIGMDRLDELLAQSDYVILSLPSTEETCRLMNREKFGKMKDGSFLVNIGRGNVIVEEDLVNSLRDGPLSGAALDVFEEEPLPPSHPLWGCDNVIVSPHIAYDSPKNMERCMDLFLHNVACYMEGKPLRNVVDKQLGY